MKLGAKKVQRKIEDYRPIHFTVESMMKRLGTIDGISVSTSITTLAREMFGTKKSDIAHNLLILSLSDKDIHCEVTPQLTEALCN